MNEIPAHRTAAPEARSGGETVIGAEQNVPPPARAIAGKARKAPPDAEAPSGDPA